MGSGYYPVDNPPGAKALPLGLPAPGMKGKGAPPRMGKRPPTGKRSVGKKAPPFGRKASKR